MTTNPKTGLVEFRANSYPHSDLFAEPKRYLSEKISYDAVQVLKLRKLSPYVRLRLAINPYLLSEHSLRLFAIWCAEQVIDKRRDFKLAKILKVSARYANGEASYEELVSARWAYPEEGFAPKVMAARATCYDLGHFAAWAAAREAAEGKHFGPMRERQLITLGKAFKEEGLRKVVK